LRSAIELIEQDNTTYAPGETEILMIKGLLDLQQSTEELHTRFAQFLPPRQNDDSGLYKVLRVGECFYAAKAKCYGNWTFYPEIGYTRELAMAGLDEQMYTFIDAGSAFVTQRDYTVGNSHFRLMNLISDDFQESLGAVQEVLLGFTGNTSRRDTILVVIIVILIIVCFVTMTYIGMIGPWII
jgi:hypothetical protein